MRLFIKDSCYNGDLELLVKSFSSRKELNSQSIEGENKAFGMYFVTRGTVKVSTPSESCLLSRGAVFFTFPHIYTKISSDDNAALICISFLGKGVVDYLSSSAITESSFASKSCTKLVRLAESTLEKVSPQSEKTIALGILLCGISLVKSDILKKSRESYSFRPKFDAILSYINENFQNPDISLSKVAGDFSYTDKYLSSMFKKKTGSGFNAYLTEIRIKTACDLLKRKDFTVATVATAVGYRDSLYFSKIFKKHTGKTPTEYSKFL